MNSRKLWRVTSGTHDPATVRRLLDLLPNWFGIEAANVDYVESAGKLPNYLARPIDPAAVTRSEPVGVLLAKRHYPESAEVYLLAVHPQVHRRGVGRALIEALEADLIADGCEFLQVKTLGPSHPDAGYAETRQFYLRLGFRPLEELRGLWGPNNPCLIMVKQLGC